MKREMIGLMSMNDDVKKTLPLIGAVFFILLAIVSLAYQYSRPRTGAVVLPGGITYLGPSPTPSASGKIPVAADAAWATQTGKKYPYSFLYPSTLSLGVFPDDPFDAVTIFWGDTNTEENLVPRGETIKDKKKSKKEYVWDWWKDYTWKGGSDITEFTNNKGLKGYRAKYLDSSGSSPFDHVFFEVPNRPELVIWMSGKMLEQGVFDKIVDSVTWSL